MSAVTGIESTRPAWRIGPALLLGMLLISVLPLGLVGIWQLSSFESSLRATVTDGLVAIARKKVHEINDYIDDVAVDARLVAQSKDTREQLAAGSDAATARLPGASRDFYERLYDSGSTATCCWCGPMAASASG